MTSTFKKTTCRVLVASLLTLSFHTAQAGLIGAEQAGAPVPVDNRGTVLQLLDRADVASQLQSAGVDPRAARERVATMSDAEVAALAQDIQTAPAGAGLDGGGWLALIVIVGVVWYFAFRK
jgi:hypothetical protein